jgi:hypothetical protein
MAMAVQKLFPGAQVTIGPAIERGFYYDFDMPEPITEQDLKAVKKEMQRIIKADLPFIREEVSTPGPFFMHTGLHRMLQDTSYCLQEKDGMVVIQSMPLSL